MSKITGNEICLVEIGKRETSSLLSSEIHHPEGMRGNVKHHWDDFFWKIVITFPSGHINRKYTNNQHVFYNRMMNQ
jgi:hypothetical protein